MSFSLWPVAVIAVVVDVANVVVFELLLMRMRLPRNNASHVSRTSGPKDSLASPTPALTNKHLSTRLPPLATTSYHRPVSTAIITNSGISSVCFCLSLFVEALPKALQRRTFVVCMCAQEL